MFHKGLFILAHECGDVSFYHNYNKLIKNQWKPYNELKHDQEKQLGHLIHFAYENVPYYHNLFRDFNLLPIDIKTVEDLEKLPILTKKVINEHWEELKPANLSSIKYYNQATGGSTGTPMKYRLSKLDRFLGGAILYRGWGYGGYKLGDKMVFLAGSSIGGGSRFSINKKAHELSRNIRKYSSFDMGEVEMQKYASSMRSFKPHFVRGYPSSIYFFANWVEENQITLPEIRAIYTTSEKLHLHMRKRIGDIFHCEVFDGYGLNDGGVSAYECPEHTGLHIDTERSISEVVDSDMRQIDSGSGTIIATSLFNYAMPFIRYDTGDEGEISDGWCSCGRHNKMVKEIVGRSVDMLVTPEGKNVHGWFFLYLFWEYGKGIKEYQVVQTAINQIDIKIILEEGLKEIQFEKIKEIIIKKSPGWVINFIIVEKIDKSNSGKYKFIINNILNKEF
jgi:phenylacetate-CoA ligase